MNNCNFIGRLTKDIELKENQKGLKYALFTIAVRRKKGSDTDFIDCIAFGQTAETLSLHTEKGHQIGINGRLQIAKKKNDEKQRIFNIVVEDFSFIEPKKDKKEQEKANMKIVDDFFAGYGEADEKDDNPFKIPIENDIFDPFGNEKINDIVKW